MTTVHDVPADRLIAALANKLRDNDAINPPQWADFVTTGVHKEKPPVEKDWWYTRTAAVLRKVYTDGPIGSSRLRAHFGGPKDRGAAPDRAAKGSGSIVREALQQLEAAGFVSGTKDAGREVTSQGMSLVDNTAHELRQELNEAIPGLEKY